MMKIRVISYQGQPLAQALEHDFDELGGTIGRAETNQLALPDPQRHISRLQARVVVREGHYELINQGANPIGINGHSIPNGSAVPLAPGSRIEIGGYLMEAAAPPPPLHPSQEVTIAPEAFAAARRAASPWQAPPPPVAAPVAPAVPISPIAPQPAMARPMSSPQPVAAHQPVMPQAAAPLAGGPVDDPLGLFGGASSAGGGDPFADILAGVGGAPVAHSVPPAPPVAPAAAPSSPLMSPTPVAELAPAPSGLPIDDPLAAWSAPQPAAKPSESASLAELLAATPTHSNQPMPSNRAPLIPDDFDPFADPFAAPPAPAPEPNPLDELDFGLAGKSGSASSIDTAYGLGPAAPGAPDPFLGSSLSDPLAGRGGDAPIDPLAPFSGEVAPPLPGFQTMPDQVPELNGAFVPPRADSFAAPAPGAFAPSPSPAAETASFVSWDKAAPAHGPAVAPTPIAPIAPAAPTVSEDPLLAMFGSGSGGAPSDALGLGVAPIPGDDLLASFDVKPATPAAPLAPSVSPGPAAFSAPLVSPTTPSAPVPPAAEAHFDFNAPTLTGDTWFGIGQVQTPAQAFASQAPVAPVPAAPAHAEPIVQRAFGEAAAAPAPARPQPAAATTGGASDEALLRAFLTGLGAPNLPLEGGITPELMERVGRLLRESTQGTLDLLLARATTKREVKADVTMIVSTDNNPLKFSPDVQAALLHLLVPQGPGFLSPVAAMRDAYDDLRSHQFGFMAGLRAALAGVLKRFDPAVLEQRLAQKSMLDSVLPMNRRAKLWDLYIALYRDIANEAEDDFHTLFGREFLRAYQEQVDRLGKSGK